MKLNFNFMTMLGPVLAALVTLGCGGGKASRPETPDGGDAQRLVALLDYVAGDYGRAVRGGQVLVSSEYEEQIRFITDARTLAANLVGPGTGNEALLARLAEAERRVREKAEPAAVAESCRAARDAVVLRFHLRTMPTERPSLARAQGLFVQSCAVCHGATGDGQTERARELNPAPANFRDAERLAHLSPYRVYNALTFGVPGTAMAAFDALAPAERWSLAFYVLRLGHEGQSVEQPTAMPLGDMALFTDEEALATLRAEGHSRPLVALAYLRREAPFAEPPAGVGIERTRRLVRQAVDEYEAGRVRAADRLVLDAYLQGFEPLEVRLRVRQADATTEVEDSFRDLRAAISRGAPAGEVGARALALDGRLVAVAGERQPLMPVMAAALIYFREGIEAALLVGALLAGARRLGRPEATRYVHQGWLAALPAGVLTWFVFDRLVSLGSHERELMEAGVSLLAAVVLFSVSFWMISKVESRHWMEYLRRQMASTLDGRSLAVLSGLAFLAVYREAAETVLFTQALLLESAAHRSQVWAGAGLGLLAVALVAVVMNRTVRRLPLAPFFAVSSLLLCGLAISFAGAGIYELVAAGYLSPRPVRFPEVRWLGVHPDLTGLVVQLAIVLVVAAGGLATLRGRAGTQPKP